MRIKAPIHRLVGSIHRRPYLYFTLAVLSAMVMLGFVYRVPGREGPGLTLKSKIEDLLPESAPSVKAMEVLQARLGSADILVATLMSDDLDKLKPALPELARALEAHEDIRKVVWRQDVAMIDQNALIIFPSLKELEDYYEALTAEIKEAVKGKLKLFEDEEAAAVEAAPRGPANQETLAWAEWEQDDGLSNLGRTFRSSRGDYREYFYNRAYTTIGLQIYPTQPSGDLAFAQHILETTQGILEREIAARFGPIGPKGLVKRVDLGGGYRHTIQESNQVKHDMLSSAGMSFALLTLIIIGFFRSVRAFVVVMAPLILGLAWTMGFVALTVGYLNLITAFIFAVLMGLGIDFGIHFYGRYREERAAGAEPLEAMEITHLETGSANVLAATTTCMAFLALTLADFKGFSQFGGVAAVGVLLCLVAVFIVFTALIFIYERWLPLKLLGYRVARGEGGQIQPHRFPLGGRTVTLFVLIAVVGAALGVREIQFELDMRRLGQKTEETQEYKEIQYGTTQATSPAVIFTHDAEEARAIFDQLQERVDKAGGEHPRLKSFQSLFNLVPTQQEEKKQWVKKICRKLARKVRIFEGDQRDGADELLRHCEPEGFTVIDLPDWVKAKFSDREGRLGEFIFVSPRGSTSDGEVALAFREEMLSLEGKDKRPPVVSGKPMIWAEIILAMKHDGAVTAAASLLIVVLLLFLFERRFRATGIILLPLGVGLGVTALVMVLLDIKLNFFNMLALPTVIGMGVDDGVHLYHRYKELGPGSAWYIVRTTGMSAILTTLTTSVGFGSLMMANHYGLNSLGFLTIVGMSAALFTSLVILPAALQWIDDHQAASRPQA
ncbi:MMPL family transporter [Myxococcota bacterium]|nr:MMPL family transporter [Myxococcota bacterium]MBU1899398.1 MMPL family transporter [Myxococcota bacterium]